MTSSWRLVLRGGAYDGWKGDANTLGEVLIAWVCDGEPDCDGHATFDAENPAINLLTAEAYRRQAVDLDERSAVYVAGDGAGSRRVGVREMELVR